MTLVGPCVQLASRATPSGCRGHENWFPFLAGLAGGQGTPRGCPRKGWVLWPRREPGGRAGVGSTTGTGFVRSDHS